MARPNFLSSHFIYLSGFPSGGKVSNPMLTISAHTSSKVMYQVVHSDKKQNGPLVTGYEVFRYSVPMIGEYVNADTKRRVTISSVIPGARYRITAQALDGQESSMPVVRSITAGEISESVALPADYGSISCIT